MKKRGKNSKLCKVCKERLVCLTLSEAGKEMYCLRQILKKLGVEELLGNDEHS